jgi:bisphosphoglycerate-independent phosphoglycerate mutase (AlkP superfamily)
MSSRWRRFEVLLPLQFNDGRDVPPELLADAVLEIVDKRAKYGILRMYFDLKGQFISEDRYNKYS